MVVLSLLGLTWLALMVTRSHPSGQTAVLSQLQKPAAAPLVRVGPGPVHTAVTLAGAQVGIDISPNHAAQPQRVRLTLTGPLTGARVSISYSMPSMNMPSVLTAPLRPLGAGRYSARITPLVMPGDWLISFRIMPAHGRPLLVSVADQMPR